MSDSIFNLFNNKPAAQTPQNNFLSFVQQVRQNGISPEQTVRQLVNSKVVNLSGGNHEI